MNANAYFNKLTISATLAVIVATLLTGCGPQAVDNANDPLSIPPKPSEFAGKGNSIDFSSLDFQHLEASRDAAWKPSMGLRTDDALVAFAWRGVITNLIARQQEVTRTAKALADADVLNMKNASGPYFGNENKWVQRRGIANDYGTALYNWDNALNTLQGSYVQELYKFQVPSSRIGAESENISKILGDQLRAHLRAHVDTEHTICSLQKKIALQYNYTIGSLEMYHQRAAAIPPNMRNNPNMVSMLTEAKADFDSKVAELNRMKQQVDDLSKQTVAAN